MCFVLPLTLTLTENSIQSVLLSTLVTLPRSANMDAPASLSCCVSVSANEVTMALTLIDGEAKETVTTDSSSRCDAVSDPMSDEVRTGSPLDE